MSCFLLIAAILSLTPQAVGATSAVVVKPVANMYSAPTETANVVSQAIYGTNVTVLEEKDRWARVRTPDEYAGWTPLAALRVLSPGESPYASAGRVVQVESLFANLYAEPDVARHRPLLTIPFETRLEVVEATAAGTERWVAVRLAASSDAAVPESRQAWIQRGDVIFDPKPRTIGQTLLLARRFLGLTYLWGGSSSFGFDCSGFTQVLIRARGIVMPRDADLQAAWKGAVPVKRNKLKPGDLLFFGESSGKITHTGMYIGKGRFIHDTTHEHPGVQISRLKDQPWTRLLVAARRVK